MNGYKNIKIMFDWFRGKTTKKPEPPKKHEHLFVLQYRTGNPLDGKTEVLKCDCEQWAIRPYGASEYTHIQN